MLDVNFPLSIDGDTSEVAKATPGSSNNSSIYDPTHVSAQE
jgi:hypothetical protein